MIDFGFGTLVAENRVVDFVFEKDLLPVDKRPAIEVQYVRSAVLTLLCEMISSSVCLLAFSS